MSYQFIEVRYPTGKYIAETGHLNGKVFWDNIFFENKELKDLTKPEQQNLAKNRLRRLLEIYKKVTEYIECPTCRQQFEEPEWDRWFIEGNHDLCPSCLFSYGQLTPKEQQEFQAKFKGVVI
jgi:hypothetical protein